MNFSYMTEYLHIVNVAVEPGIERSELRANQDERRGDPCGLQESVQIIHHPARQHHSSVPAQTQDRLQTGSGGSCRQPGGTGTSNTEDEHNEPKIIPSMGLLTGLDGGAKTPNSSRKTGLLASFHRKTQTENLQQT